MNLKTFDLIIKYFTFFLVISDEHNFTYMWDIYL